MKLNIKRAYDKPEKIDGTRVLVDRLWPRGVTKEKAAIDVWAKDIAPSNELRKWFHTDPDERWPEFKKGYTKELKGNREAVDAVVGGLKGTVTLVTAAKDVAHSHVPVFKEFIENL